LTVATEVFDELQLATFVTSFEVLSESVAVAENWVVTPTLGAVPVTDTKLAVAAA
jgi:hypothetical protein